MRSVLKWADGKIIKEVVDAKIENILGPKTDEDLAPVTKEHKQTPSGDKVATKQVNNNKFPKLTIVNTI